MTQNTRLSKDSCIIVVDDDLGLLLLMKGILAIKGFQALCMASGEEALEKIKEGYGSMMITDRNMSGMNGLELTRRVKEIKPFMPVIMITGDYSPEKDQLAIEAGICTVLHKPCEPEMLLNIVNDLNGKILKRKDSIAICSQ